MFSLLSTVKLTPLGQAFVFGIDRYFYLGIQMYTNRTYVKMQLDVKI